MMLAVSPYYVAFNGLLVLLLAFLVVRQRMKQRVAFGDGGAEPLALAIRVHANAVEYVPIALILLVVLELAGGSETWIHILGATLSVSRVLHAVGFGRSKGTSVGRFLGTNGTWFAIAASAVLLVLQASGRV